MWATAMATATTVTTMVAMATATMGQRDNDDKGATAQWHDDDKLYDKLLRTASATVVQHNR